MPQLGRLSKIHLLAAIRDYRKDGEADLLERFGLDGADADVMVVDRGQQYDARLLVLAAHDKVVGERLAVEELPADLATFLGRLELTAVSRRELLAAETLKAARQRVPGTPRVSRATRSAAPAAPEKAAPPVCPRCMMQLPAGSKACDYCD